MPVVWVLLFGIACHKDPMVDKPLTIPPAETWWNEGVFYEIFVRSFYDSDGDGNGDLQGIIQKLDYLNDGNPNTNTDLGITAIWLMPIYPSPSYHGYDVTDFRTVNPQYGSINDFQKLVSEAHKRGIKVILDFEINDTSDQHPWFINSATSISAGKRNWYVWSGTNPNYTGPWGQTVWYEKNGAYYYGVFSSAMPDLNYSNQEVTAEIEDITRYWHKDMMVDGFRMDAAPLLIEEGQNQDNTYSTKNWWRNYYSFQKNMNPAFMSVGEVWTSTDKISPYADQRLDYCFEFDLAYAIIDAVQNSNVNGLKSKMKEVVNSYPALQYGVFLTNHDQIRVIEQLGLNEIKAKAAAGILLSLPGVPYLYYGEEVGMMGQKPDPAIRRPMQWNGGANAGFTTVSPWFPVNPNYISANVMTMQSDPNSLWNHYRKLIHVRTESTPLKQGSYEPLNSNAGNVFSFMRVKGGEAVLAIHNLGIQPVQGLQLSI